MRLVNRPLAFIRTDRLMAGHRGIAPVAKPLDDACCCGQPWNIGLAHGPKQTVLDDVPTPTDQVLPEISASDAYPLDGEGEGAHRYPSHPGI